MRFKHRRPSYVILDAFAILGNSCMHQSSINRVVIPDATAFLGKLSHYLIHLVILDWFAILGNDWVVCVGHAQARLYPKSWLAQLLKQSFGMSAPCWYWPDEYFVFWPMFASHSLVFHCIMSSQFFHENPISDKLAAMQVVTQCCVCHLVRDDDGQWHDAQPDISAEVSHGLCSSCEAEYLAELERYGRVVTPLLSDA